MSQKKSSKIKLGVNIDHIATLRQVRGGSTSYPDLLALTQSAVRAGADQITLHLREDRRHIQVSDLELITKNINVPVNLEMAPTSLMVRYARKYKPQWVCLVPEKREELTTEGGLDVRKNQTHIATIVDRIQSLGIEISLFIEPSEEQVLAAYRVGADAVEFHTGKWVLSQGNLKKKIWKKLEKAAELAESLDISVHAGHGLDYDHLKKIKSLKHLKEVNIGHSIICYALEDGISGVVRKMKKILK
ncbi:MAG TPA: pyridoxine 5'-phosphate synthase [Pseudobdellovibrionaceae bacterium]|nr:pyridoxine 5'-phosphate synthase [Pseudobdellovibrionaceae bacterium]